MAQTGKDIFVDYKVETAKNTAPATSAAERMRITSGGLSLRKQAVRSQTIRADGQTDMARHGSVEVAGSYSGELSVGSWDTLLVAAARSTLVAAVAITNATASLASISFGTNAVWATTTSLANGWLDAGMRVGDVFRVSGTGGANDGVVAQIYTVTTHTMICNAGAFTADASAVVTFTTTIGKKISNATTPVRRTFYIDEYLQDIDYSTVYGGVRFTGFGLTGSPNGMANISLNALGMSATPLGTGASPFYVSPQEYTTDSLTFVDAVIAIDNAAVAAATAFSMSYDTTASTLPVIGSTVTPDVFDNESRISGSMTILREDLQRLTTFSNETEAQIHVLLKETGASPGYVSLYVPRVKFMSVESPLGGDGAMTETIAWEGGVKAATSANDQTMFTITTST